LAAKICGLPYSEKRLGFGYGDDINQKLNNGQSNQNNCDRPELSIENEK
jgi:hypothetical protein